ncbi:MAG: hypothetical protein GF320_20630 [Armatimonadia bacterium]|nr:hypothetical protein [Armatimonadia bacterium]
MDDLFSNVFFWVFGVPLAVGALSMVLDFFKKMAKMKQKQIELETRLNAQADGDLLGWVDRDDFQALQARVDELETELAALKGRPADPAPRTLDPIEEPPENEETLRA